MNELARLAGTLADALREFAAGLDQPPPTEPEPEPEPATPPKPADEHALGKRQLQIVELDGLATEAGLKTADVAAAIGYEVPNTYTALQALARGQVVEQVPHKEPQHWRLVRRYRATSQAYADAVRLLEPGEWTTAADVSIAVRGDLRATEAILRANLSDRVVETEAEGRQVGWRELANRAAAARTRRRTRSHGVLTYVQIPATDLDESSTFFEHVFGWRIDRHPAVGNAGEQTSYPEFADATGHNGGGFVLGLKSIRPCIAVDSIDDALALVIEHGGAVTQPKTAIVEGVDWEAEFTDPAGNTFGLYEEARRDA